MSRAFVPGGRCIFDTECNPDKITAGWQDLFGDPLLSLERVRAKGTSGYITDDSLRSLYWRVYLEFLPLSPDAWLLLLAKERQGYADLKAKYMSDPNAAAKASNDWTLNNPLSTAEESPWTQYFKDAELQKVIRQDVERTFPDEPTFRSKDTQDLMTGILFIWCKLNMDVSYRQGMHELLAPILLVVKRDALDPDDVAGKAELDPTIAATFDSEYIEHDTAVMFFCLMRSTKPWFEAKIPQVPIITICRRIQNDLLRVLDPKLYQHLDKQQIEPQLYGLRWFRLLFGREFALPDLIYLWDGIFADDANLGLVEWICVALLLYLKDDLIGKDYSWTLHTLMKLPITSLATVTQLIRTARHLRDKFADLALQTASSDTFNSPTNSVSFSFPASSPTFTSPSPSSQGPQALNQVMEKHRKKRNVPWVQHTPSSPVRQNSTGAVGGNAPKKEVVHDGDTVTPAGGINAAGAKDGGEARFKERLKWVTERDRRLAEKVAGCIRELTALLGDTEQEGKTEVAGKDDRDASLRSVLGSMRGVLEVLDSECTEQTHDSEHTPDGSGNRATATPVQNNANADGDVDVDKTRSTTSALASASTAAPTATAPSAPAPTATTAKPEVAAPANPTPTSQPAPSLPSLQWGSNADIRHGQVVVPRAAKSAAPSPSSTSSANHISSYTRRENGPTSTSAGAAAAGISHRMGSSEEIRFTPNPPTSASSSIPSPRSPTIAHPHAQRTRNRSESGGRADPLGAGGVTGHVLPTTGVVNRTGERIMYPPPI
ncbi:rab-GTPase-TBC domain-containing protein [Fimicolochytrium jonesii]|uniref:rab-GTPase-TBC domain-containing protein n=1 Tax=Fimicolochytrium jonesii TaxID=1396493 RepID=UPI0022FF2703|nr:rab-GTPase-TBC domain-containing protein [Fimicolochytrium jonesii]KAI8816106.1 rab-GTPase-TBC domain-containing protein [Fimicolochytrium jonesii]